jgi:iron complex transport system ATP-binding protein
MLKLQELTIGYPSRKLIAPTTLEVGEGELCVLLGTNGVGKSTLLRTVAGLRKPLSGVVCYREEDVHRMHVSDRASLLAVVLPQGAEGGGLSVTEIMRLARLNEREDERASERVHRALAQMEITHLAQRKMDMLSDGERQKVMVARALAQDTPLMIWDEPTVFLDYPARKKVMDVIERQAHEEGKTILCSSHDLHLIQGRADRIWLIHNEQLRELDPKSSVEELEKALIQL